MTHIVNFSGGLCSFWAELRGITPFSILKDRRGGVTKNLWLRDLRLRVEVGEKFTKLDWGGCGCGGAVGVSKNVEDY